MKTKNGRYPIGAAYGWRGFSVAAAGVSIITIYNDFMTYTPLKLQSVSSEKLGLVQDLEKIRGDYAMLSKEKAAVERERGAIDRELKKALGNMLRVLLIRANYINSCHSKIQGSAGH